MITKYIFVCRRQPSNLAISQRKADLHRGDFYASTSSLGSTGSTSTPGGTHRKKKPAPPPPIVKELFASDGDSRRSPNSTPNTYSGIVSTITNNFLFLFSFSTHSPIGENQCLKLLITE